MPSTFDVHVFDFLNAIRGFVIYIMHLLPMEEGENIG